MRINSTNNINNNTAFKKVISVKSSKHHDYSNCACSLTERDIAKVLNNEKCNTYSKEEKKQIKDFFKIILGDDSKNVIYKHCNEGRFFVSGREAKDITSISKFVSDARHLEIPNTEYKQSGNYYKGEGEMKAALSHFQNFVIEYAFPKMNEIIRKTYNNDTTKATVEIINDNRNSSKAQSIIATVTTQEGTEQATLNFSA